MDSKVAIITLNYNQNDYSVKCAESIIKSDYKNFKLFLIDNGSSLENFKQIKETLPADPNLELKRIEKNRGYVGGINYGLEIASQIKPDYILIMNNDTILDKSAISQLVKTCKDFKDMAIVSGKVYHYEQPNILQDIGFSFENEKALKFNRVGVDQEDKGQFDQIAERALLDDVFWLFPSKLYTQIGGYSTYFWFSAEQADFALRAKKVGYKLIYAPLAKIWHKGSASFGGRDRNPKVQYWHIQSTLIFRYLHLSRLEFIKLYFKVIRSILSSYFVAIKDAFKAKKSAFGFPNAKLKGFMYFNKWYFLRNENSGKNPFS